VVLIFGAMQFEVVYVLMQDDYPVVFGDMCQEVLADLIVGFVSE
jgi:hypothetical protein